ncbi:peroxisome biogenesis protein 5 isoform X3 [Gossypium hirsutum]|uniref:Peroxisome biogenesis protein 5 isoform X3 n=1 Tax=Gossypium hirsutum TaxID=3635 RepID=A0ABM2Z0T4_GOSHI|nr:peroxisome biogenesis protein 5 isoform X3 [Gossypium hirsutum]XP_040936335.1 peroxisome biogenesis protein 5 isoform X3 [Gossypium hirsutum]
MWRVPFNLIVRFDKSSRRKSQLPWCMKMVLAFRDIAPQAPTHVLIIPKSKDGLSALDLKPNYVRAWANMGISYTNQGMYEESIRYYVRALAMNPKADNAWQYLRTSLSCVSRNNMVEACDSRNLELLQEFPL